jgi:hypothetical protein
LAGRVEVEEDILPTVSDPLPIRMLSLARPWDGRIFLNPYSGREPREVTILS